MSRRYPRTGGAALPLALLLGVWTIWGCGLLDKGPSENARVLIEGAEGHPIQLVTSNDFDVVISEGGEDRETQLNAADTALVTVPFDMVYSLGPRTRFYVDASSYEIAPGLVRMRVFIDEDLRYDATTTFDEESLTFTYTSW